MSDGAVANDALTASAWQQRAAKEREWQQTPLGAAFCKFERATQRYWQQDSNEHISHKRLTELDDASRKAREEFMLLLRGW